MIQYSLDSDVDPNLSKKTKLKWLSIAYKKTTSPNS